MTTTDRVESQSETERQLPRRAQFFTSWDDPMPERGAFAGKLTGTLPFSGTRPDDAPSDVESVWYDFGTDENPGRVFIVKYGPGYFNPAHSHDTDYCSIVVEGSVEIARKTFGPGAIRFVKAETTYGPIIVGPEGATVIEFFPGPPGGHGPETHDAGPVPPQPYDYFTPAARRLFLSPWINGTDNSADS